MRTKQHCAILWQKVNIVLILFNSAHSSWPCFKMSLQLCSSSSSVSAAQQCVKRKSLIFFFWRKSLVEKKN